MSNVHSCRKCKNPVSSFPNGSTGQHERKMKFYLVGPTNVLTGTYCGKCVSELLGEYAAQLIKEKGVPAVVDMFTDGAFLVKFSDWYSGKPEPKPVTKADLVAALKSGKLNAEEVLDVIAGMDWERQ